VWHQEDGWEPDRWAAYRVRLHSGRTVYVPIDDGKYVTAEGPRAGMMFDFSKAAAAGTGVSQRAEAQHGFECPCCVDQGPDDSLMF
jgi:hypothetical protein